MRAAVLMLAMMALAGCSGSSTEPPLPTRDLEGTPEEFGYPPDAYDPCPHTRELFTLGTLCVNVPATAGAVAHEVEVRFGAPVGGTTWTFTVPASVRSFWPPEPLGAERIRVCDHDGSVMVEIRSVDPQGVATHRVSGAANQECAAMPTSAAN